MKALKVVGTIGRLALAGVLIAGHFVMNIIMLNALKHAKETELNGGSHVA